MGNPANTTGPGTGRLIAFTDRLGFGLGKGGAHLARTLMLGELKALLSHAKAPGTPKEAFFRAIEDDNCLAKRSVSTRKLTARHLASLYSLDPAVPLFRGLRHFWKRDPAGRPLLAVTCACARDAVLRSSAAFIQALAPGRPVSREALENFIDHLQPGRFSPATLKSAVRNLSSSWTQSGHLRGKVKKVRAQARATPGAVAYALFLGYLKGVRGESLFSSEYAKLLDCPAHQAMELASEASARGWLVMKRLGDVIEVLFPNLLTDAETGWLREQN